MKAKIYIDDVLHGLRIMAMAVTAALLCLLPGACDHSDLWDEVPGEISQFINEYFPNSELVSVTHTSAGYHIRIDDGPGLAFDTDYKWTDVDGYGMPVPQVFLFDQLPPRLYDYLQETQQLNAVFSVSRDAKVYTLTLLSSTLTYEISTGELRGTDAS